MTLQNCNEGKHYIFLLFIINNMYVSLLTLVLCSNASVKVTDIDMLLFIRELRNNIYFSYTEEIDVFIINECANEIFVEWNKNNDN